ncbi:Mrp/NBP35 family ATP-binding protein [Qipengyuania sp. DY56-A-20]|jgi:ATP-binding protein involved in chromosome partitioning|uniref:Iron-sulfur cluster carrier protein n=1 Tax=Qipengyuania benthica TaxID=3067651 RepID=A0ABT9H5P2_9SPHN|nr:Mrp/NBP35 family ATP-binding protein [Qipengyuania sp. DY56-A-20]MDP4538374.1 Mrp/NBP35 family ATP-binding protein [Qipengyuania sp. DY56-A-20]
MVDHPLIAALPAPLRDRVTSATMKDGRATVVLDVAGLDPRQREQAEAAVTQRVGAAAGVNEVRVILTAERKARRIVAVGSGKGGVGKSTLTANLAVALHRMGHKVGLVDADIYGPSQPTILGNQGVRPEAREDKLVPVASAVGVPVLSMGHLVKPGQAIAWRGPMAGNALSQLIDAHWGDAELLLVDLPPGTGDVQLTMLQKFKPAGAVLVSTPQDLALIDAARAGQLFDQAGVPVIGLVENMAGYACPHCGEISDPFGAGGVEEAARRLELPFLGRIPLDLAIRQGSDSGQPPAAGDGAIAEPFRAIAAKLAAWLAKTS